MRREKRVVVDAHLERIAEYEQDIAENPGVARFVRRLDREVEQLRALAERKRGYSGLVRQRLRQVSI